jgi:hypothetical protein
LVASVLFWPYFSNVGVIFVVVFHAIVARITSACLPVVASVVCWFAAVIANRPNQTVHRILTRWGRGSWQSFNYVRFSIFHSEFYLGEDSVTSTFAERRHFTQGTIRFFANRSYGVPLSCFQKARASLIFSIRPHRSAVFPSGQSLVRQSGQLQ